MGGGGLSGGSTTINKTVLGAWARAWAAAVLNMRSVKHLKADASVANL